MPSGEEARAQTTTQEIPLKYKKTLFYCEHGQTLAQVGQRVSIPGDIQNLTEHSLEQQADCSEPGVGTRLPTSTIL